MTMTGMIRVLWLAAILGLSGCMGGSTGPASDPNAPRPKGPDGSFIIDALEARQSVIPSQGSYAKVASAVLATNQNAAQAELRAARLRSEAEAKNWLPRIGPVVSLSSLGDLVANIVLEQVIFDNGRKKAQRAYAKADVEVAAVSLAEDTNKRVYEAIELYLDAQRAREKGSVARRAHDDMDGFRWIMQQRVDGGVADLSDLRIIDHKLAEIDADLRAARDTENAAQAELGAMSASSLAGLRGISKLASPAGQKPLAVLKAEAEKERSIASAKIERADQLPGVKVTGSAGDSGERAELRLDGDALLGLGTGAAIRAANAAQQAANARIKRAEEDSNRRLAALKYRYEALRRQSAEAAQLAKQAKANLDMFQSQYEAGQRQVMDVVGVYETYARQEIASVQKKYEAASAALEIALEYGALVDGAEI